MLTQSPSLTKLKRPFKPLTDQRSQNALKKTLSRKTLENSLKSSNLLGISATARAHTQIQEDNSMTTNALSTSHLIASPKSNLVRKPGKPGTLLKLGRRSPAKNSLVELDISKGHNQTEVHSREFSLERSSSPTKGDKSASSALDLSLLPEKRNLLKPLVMAGALNLREELQKEVDSSPLSKVDKSALFYDTTKHLDQCGKCFTSCQKHHKSPFTIDYRGPRESVYRRDFSPAAAQVIQTEPSATMISSQIYESPRPKYGVPINSTNRNDFRAWDSNLVKDKGPASSLGPNNGSYFWGKSTYNASYYDYGSPKVMGDLRNYNSSAALDLPFTGQSLYKKDFSGLDLANSPKKIQKKERSPLPLGSIFLGETSNARVYKNYNVSPVPSTLARRDNDEEYNGGTKAYLNQYKSTYGKDFTPKIESKCAANEYAETHEVPRLRRPLPRHNV